MKLATVRLPHRSTHAIGDRVQERSPRHSDAHGRRGKAEAGGKDVRALQFRSVLVPLDGSQAAEHAIPWALGHRQPSGRLYTVRARSSGPAGKNKHWPIIDLGRIRRRRKEDFVRSILSASPSGLRERVRFRSHHCFLKVPTSPKPLQTPRDLPTSSSWQPGVAARWVAFFMAASSLSSFDARHCRS